MNCKVVKPLLTALLLDELAPKEAEQIREHLAICSVCQSACAELQATLELLKQTFAARLENEQKLSELRRNHVTQEALRRRAARRSAWRMAIGFAAILLVSMGLTTMLLPSLYSARKTAEITPQSRARESLLVQVPKPGRADKSSLPHSVEEEAAPPALSEIPHSAPNTEISLAAAEKRINTEADKIAKGAAMRAAQHERAIGLTYVAPETAQATEKPKQQDVASLKTKPESNAPQPEDRLAVATPSLESPPEPMRLKPDGTEKNPPQNRQPSRKPKPPTPPLPLSLALPAPAPGANVFGAAQSSFAKDEWPPAARIRTEQFIATIAMDLPSPPHQSLVADAEIAVSPFRPGLHLLLLNVWGSSTNKPQNIARGAAAVHLRLNPARIKRMRLPGFDDQPLRTLIPPEIIIETLKMQPNRRGALLIEMELQGDNTQPLGSVFVRYTNSTNTQEELLFALERKHIRSDVARATPGFRIVVAAAELAELLKLGPGGAPSLPGVISLLQRATLEFSLNPKARDLLDMAEAAKALTPP